MKRKLSYLIGTGILVIFMSMGGCTLLKSRFARLTTDFEVLPSDSRILYENGAEALAEEAALHLPNALKSVESKQYGKFKEPITVYAFASTKSFSKFSGITEKARGASVGSEVYLSGMLLDLPEEVYGMIGHELSHVQLSQTLGTITFNRTLPIWFREGLAIYVSDGGGAPRNFDQETIDMFLQGKHFIPEVEGSLINRSFKTTAPIGPRMLYSQSGMFVKYIANTYPDNFQTFLFGIQKNKQFEDNFKESFGKSVVDIFQSYMKTLRKA